MKVNISLEVENFIPSLEKQTIAKILRTIDLLEAFGHKLGMPHSKKVADKLFELRIRGGQEIRIFYAFHKDAACLLHGFVKKQQKMPRKELNTAISRLNRLTAYNI